MPANRTARDFWLEEPVRGEVLIEARHEMTSLSRIAFNRDWLPAAVIVALQKHQQSVRKTVQQLAEVKRSYVLISSVTDHLTGVSYVTDDGRRATIFCLKLQIPSVVSQVGTAGDEVIDCDRYD